MQTDDVDTIDMLDKDNHKIMLEVYDIINEIFESKSPVKISTENFNVSTEKNYNPELGLGFFNGLFNNRQDLEVLMPALNKDSYNVKLCAEKNWSIVISNFCSQEIVENHNVFLKYSNLSKKDAEKQNYQNLYLLQKIKRSPKIL